MVMAMMMMMVVMVMLMVMMKMMVMVMVKIMVMVMVMVIVMMMMMMMCPHRHGDDRIDPSSFKCSVWIEAGIRHYIVGETEESPLMERPPFLQLHQHMDIEEYRGIEGLLLKGG